MEKTDLANRKKRIKKECRQCGYMVSYALALSSSDDDSGTF